jgi:hypothetical protein
MKTNFSLLWVSLIALAATGPASFAQDDNNPNSDNTSYESSDATTVVYDAPATYYASVVYQAPVIYNAPVYYIAATAAMAVSYATQPQCEHAEPVSTVYVIGGNGGSYSYSNSGGSPCATSTVIQFGQRGGWFGRR